MSIIDNLITDRSQSDVDALRALLSRGKANWTAEELAEFNLARSKGAYNYTDLNRVTAAMEYINERLNGYGYQTGYQETKPKITVSLTNIVPNSGFEQDANWSGVSYDTSEKYQGIRSSKLGPGTIINRSSQVTTPIKGHKYYGRSYIKSQGDIQPADCRFEVYAGDGAGLNFVFAWNQGNFPDWTMRSAIVDVDAVNGSSYIVRNFVVNAVNPCWTDGLMVVDLTSAFGSGEEPDQAWCDENIPYFDGALSMTLSKWWKQSDVPTASQMASYLSNVEAIRSVLEVLPTTPETPESMELLTWVEANNIEQILVDVETIITSMSQIFLRAGTSWANSGGPNFYFAN